MTNERSIQMKATVPVLCAVLSLGVGCSSTSYRISPTPAATVSWDNKALTPGELRVHNAKNGMIDPISTTAVRESVRQEHLKTGQPTTDKKTDIDIYISVDGPRGWWTFATYVCTLGFLPITLTVDEAVWGEVKVLDANGQTIHKRDMPRYSSELSSYFSFWGPLGLLGLAGGGDIQQAGIMGSETQGVLKKINEPQCVLIRVLLPEINKITLSGSEQPTAVSPAPAVEKPKSVAPQQSETERKLNELQHLLDQKLIQQDEYQKKRAEILEKM
jgi:hypothetical protein